MKREAMRKVAGGQGGISLIETTIVLAVSGILLAGFAGILADYVRIPMKISSELKASQQIQEAGLMLTEDSSVARSFAAGTEPDYGTFSWFEFSGKSAVPVTSRYYWALDPAHPKGYGNIYRELIRDNEPTPPQLVIAGVAAYGDLTLQHVEPVWAYGQAAKTWSYSEGKITFSFVTTHEAGVGYGQERPETVFAADMAADLRPQLLLPAPLPGRLGPPPPIPNQINFKISGNPSISQGSFKSGSGVDLTYDDANYHVVAATGSPRAVIWQATSEAIDYTGITFGTIQFIAKVDKAGVSQEIFVYNPTDPEHTDGGYATSPDAALTYGSTGTDLTSMFNLSDNDIAYINTLSPKVITIKVKTSYSSLFNLSSDQLVYTVGGTPSPTFSRDYLVSADPTLESGTYVGGVLASLTADDTSYYTVQEVGSVLQWRVVSEPITLDSISSLEVIFIGRATKGNPVQQMFVYNPTDPAHTSGGFGVTPDSQMTYAVAATDTTQSFFANSTDLAYIGTLVPKEVRIRVRGTDPTVNWQLQADQVIFRVKP